MYLNCSYVPDKIGRIILEIFVLFPSLAFDCCCFLLVAKTYVCVRLFCTVSLSLCVYVSYLLWLKTHWQSFSQIHSPMVHGLWFYSTSSRLQFFELATALKLSKETVIFETYTDEFKWREYSDVVDPSTEKKRRNCLLCHHIDAIFNFREWHNFPHQNTCNLQNVHRNTHTHNRIRLVKANSNNVTKSSLLSCQSL